MKPTRTEGMFFVPQNQVDALPDGLTKKFLTSRKSYNSKLIYLCINVLQNVQFISKVYLEIVNFKFVNPLVHIMHR
jgi:hypothetical protein